MDYPIRSAAHRASRAAIWAMVFAFTWSIGTGFAQVPEQDRQPAGMSGCATAVMIDPATGSRFAGADPRRDCYAIAY